MIAASMAERFFTHTFPNGLTLLAEQMPGIRSAAMTLLLPSGGATDPEGSLGSANVIVEMAMRGAGALDARQLTERLDDLGLSRSSSAALHHTRFTAASLAKNVFEALPVYADIVRRPHLRDEDFGPSRDLALQALAGLEDSPQSLVMIKLREQAWPDPLGRNTMGETADLEAMTAPAVRDDWRRRYVPAGAILSVAGDVDFAQWRDAVGQALGDWQGPAVPEPPQEAPAGGTRFIEQESQQTHIALAYPTASETDAEYYLSRMAVEVLSGGMSGRLFTEIREKRGLCYSVSAGYTSAPKLGSVFCYAGTSNERAQETLDALLEELRRLSRGVTAQELSRAKIGLKAGTVMSGESSSARSGAIARDWFIHRRLRSLDEILSAIDAITVDQLNAYLAAKPVTEVTAVFVGPKTLEVMQ
jgi:predicted Zn-dependent peptidase